MTDKRLAKDVAKELDRRQRRRKLLILAAIVALIALALIYLQCGTGFGFGKGKGKGEGKGSGSAAKVVALPDAGTPRCALRVDASGITVDGKPATQDEAVKLCAAGAEVVVTGDATQGTWDALRAALDAAKVPTYLQSK